MSAVSAAALVLGCASNVSAQSLPQWETPEYFRSGSLAQINAAAAYAQGYTGAGVKVGVADSGLWTTHSEFAGRVLPGFDFSYRASPLPVFIPTDDDDNFDLGEIPVGPPPEGGPLLPGMNRDGSGHGTHVAGIIGAARDGQEMHGVAFDASIVPAHVNLLETDSGVSEAWPFLIAQGVSIINASYRIGCVGSGPGVRCNAETITRESLEHYYPLTVQRSIDLASADVLMVVATGNDSKAHPDILAALPAIVPEVKDNWLAVAAVDSNNTIASFSNRCGIAKDWCLVAPGDDIYSTWRVDAAHPTGYKVEGGTSMAAPAVSGVAALVKQAFPWFTAYDLQQALLTTATDLGAPGVDEVYGWGLVNAGKAVRGYGMFTGMVMLDTQGYVSTFSNDISGPGGFIKAGAGTLILTGANTYSGGTAVAEGKLVLGSSTAAGTGAIALGDGTTLGFVNGINVANALAVSGNVSFDLASGMAIASGALSGAGAIAFTGDGVVSLTGDSSAFTGASTVDGTVSVNGTLGGTVNVQQGGTLEGTGTVGSTTIAAGGSVAPGTQIGTLTVNGALTFAPGSTYQADINSGGGADVIAVTGIATLGGATVSGTLEPGAFSPGTRYLILTAAGGVSGLFGQAVESMPFLDLLLIYDPTSVSLEIVRNGVPLQSAAVTRNQASAAAALDALALGNALGDAVVSQSTVASAQQAFNAVSGEVYPSALSVFQNESLILRRAVLDRARVPVAGPGAAPLAYAPGLDVAADPGSPNAFWAQGFGAWGQIDGNGNAATISGNTSGVFVGYDRTFSPGMGDWRLGFAAGYSSSSYQVDARSSSFSSDNAHVALYGGGTVGALGLRFGGAYSWADMSVSRSVVFPGLFNQLSADTTARTGQVFGEVSYGLSFASVGLEPFAGLAYVNVDLDDFSETGGPSALTSSGASEGVTYSTLGARVSVPLALGTIATSFKGTLAWQHAFGDTAPEALFAFGPGAQPFAISGAPIAADAALIEAGLDMAFTANTSLSLFYAGQLASTETNNMVKGSFTLKF
ncbi:autotransporter domain-containing protein [Aquabacter sp. CN5-332]|uniref:autotransporter domain-containing protein n=1 Tax=Aquabacter sp. CN5-332 TaxID=3156608 RepID=UPI0032B39130